MCWLVDVIMDCSFNTAEGRFNFRVGAIILHNDMLLMVRNTRDPYYYSVGGRVKMKESIEAAVIREVFEETRIVYEIDRLAFIHENFFTLHTNGQRYHELSFFFYMKPSNRTNFVGGSFTQDGIEESLEWLPLSDLVNLKVYPQFFASELLKPVAEIKHFVTFE